MNKIQPTRYFLGANSSSGFSSLYEAFVAPTDDSFFWVIKGGPGCGKSTFMKRIGAAGEAAGVPVEYIHCSGDPDSLDAVWLPTLGTGYVDGTAPHVTEAIYPGAASLYLDLGAFLDREALGPKRADLVALNRRYQAYYRDAYALLAAGAALLPRNCPGLRELVEMERVDQTVDGLVREELPELNKSSKLQRRFLSAISCKGRIFLEDSLTALGCAVLVLDNDLGLGAYALSRLRQSAFQRGYDMICCQNPLEPEQLEAVLLPEAELAVLALEQPDESSLGTYRRLHLNALAVPELPPELSAMLRQRRQRSRWMLDAAMASLADAKKLHDALEAIYQPHVDFEGVRALAERHIGQLFQN